MRRYPPLGHTINLFITRIDEYTLAVKEKLQEILPKIRGGGLFVYLSSLVLTSILKHLETFERIFKYS